MTGSEWLAYVLRKGFKRTDKDTEVYEATTDAIQEMRRRFGFEEAKADKTTTDTISVLGDFKLSVESDFGLLLDIVMQDGTGSHPLIKKSKNEFNELYPDINVTADRGYPEHFCIYDDTIYIGPIPDAVSYLYRINYSAVAGTIVAGTTSVPFTSIYRDLLADLVLALLYEGLEEYEKANYHRGKFEGGMPLAERRERVNTGLSTFGMRITDC